jgi:hypothetical protein
MITEPAQPAQKSAGRSRKYPAGRVNYTVRFTPERAAVLLEAAAKNGRSVSEEVEDRVNQSFLLGDMLDARLDTRIATLKVYLQEYAEFATSLQDTIDDLRRERDALMRLLQDALRKGDTR